MASRKDYEAIAAAIKHAADNIKILDDYPSMMVMHLTITEYVARALNAENGSFDKGRFLTACGYVRDSMGWLRWGGQ